jgi:hypothetical protein
MPRKLMRSSVVAYDRPGVKSVRSPIVLTPNRSRVSLVYADTASGTSCRLSLRFCAVTTTSSRTLVERPVLSCANAAFAEMPSTLPTAQVSGVR